MTLWGANHSTDSVISPPQSHMYITPISVVCTLHFYSVGMVADKPYL